MNDYTKILNRKYKNDSWTLNGDTYEGLEWLSESAKPTKKELDDLWPIVQDEIKAEIDKKEKDRADLLTRLGITSDEAALLLS